MLGNRDLFLDRTQLKNLYFQLNHCGIQECEPGYAYGFPMEPYHLIHFVLEGEGYLELHKKLFHVKAGQAFYIPSGTPAQYHASTVSPWKYGWIGFYANAQNPFFEYLFKESCVLDLALPLSEIERYLLSVIDVTDPRSSQTASYRESAFPGKQFSVISKLSESLEANSRMLAFFSVLIQAQIPEDAMVQEKASPALLAKAYMDENYHMPIRIKDMAAALHLHPNYLCAVFKKAYGQTPKEYLFALRMSQASMLLALNTYPISVIGQSVGYTNPLQFSAKFKDYYGLSPRDYRKKYQSPKSH